MSEEDVLLLINAWIVANGNNEITADVLRPILVAMVEQPNNVTGDLELLSTITQTNLVAAVNEVYGMISGISNSGVQLHQGTADPNVTPPATYTTADFYIQKDELNNPLDLWQYNGVVWTKYGTVTEVTGTDGVTVASGTTTPVIGLGNITPDSIITPGTISNADVTKSVALSGGDTFLYNNGIYTTSVKQSPSVTANTTTYYPPFDGELALRSSIQKTITGNVTLDNTYNGCIVKVKATANITVPYGLIKGFNAVFDAWAGATATFIQGADVDIIETTLTLAAGKMATLYQDDSTSGLTTEVYKLKGETS